MTYRPPLNTTARLWKSESENEKIKTKKWKQIVKW